MPQGKQDGLFGAVGRGLEQAVKQGQALGLAGIAWRAGGEGVVSDGDTGHVGDRVAYAGCTADFCFGANLLLLKQIMLFIKHNGIFSSMKTREPRRA